METAASLSPASRYSKLSVLTCVVFLWFHIQAIAAFWSFTWTNLLVAVALYGIAGGFGISMGYHRLHTHRGFKTHKWFEYFLAICGTLTLEGGPIFWVATHRLHHQHSDQHEDPHSPRVSGFWAHIGWIMFGEAHHNDTARMGRYAPDLMKDPFYRWLTTYHWVPLTVLGFSLLAIGGWGLVNWAIFLRVVLGQHSTWLVNSATHIGGAAAGSPPQTTPETSGGSPSSRSARAGTTTITRTRRRRATVSPGTSSIPPGCCSRRSAPWASSGMSRSRESARSHTRKKPPLSWSLVPSPWSLVLGPTLALS
jgi:fatty-acid desaturase